MSSSNNMYRVGDFVYVDQGPHVPYGVRRIDELQKSQSGNVEMEVMIYLRRMDVNKEVTGVLYSKKIWIFCVLIRVLMLGVWLALTMGQMLMTS